MVDREQIMANIHFLWLREQEIASRLIKGENFLNKDKLRDEQGHKCKYLDPLTRKPISSTAYHTAKKMIIRHYYHSFD